MLICCSCKIEMVCARNGVGARFEKQHTYPSDRYTCPCCGQEVLKTNDYPIHDPGNVFKEYWDITDLSSAVRSFAERERFTSAPKAELRGLSDLHEHAFGKQIPNPASPKTNT
jgi:hypothetical protein